MFSHTRFSENQQYNYNSPKPTLDDKSSTAGGMYQVTLESQNIFGIMQSTGKAIITKLPNNEFDIRTVLYPNDPPFYAITKPYYIHAIGRESKEEKTFICSGKVYVTKGILYKTLEFNDIAVNFKNKINSEVNQYQFSLNPFTLWGYSPGKITNSGTLTRVSEVIDDQSLQEVAYCETLKIR